MRKSKVVKSAPSGYEDFFEQAVISFCFSVCYGEAGIDQQLDHEKTVEIWRENGLLEKTKEELRNSTSLYRLISHLAFD